MFPKIEENISLIVSNMLPPSHTQVAEHYLQLERKIRNWGETLSKKPLCLFSPSQAEGILSEFFRDKENLFEMYWNEKCRETLEKCREILLNDKSFEHVLVGEKETKENPFGLCEMNVTRSTQSFFQLALNLLDEAVQGLKQNNLLMFLSKIA